MRRKNFAYLWAMALFLLVSVTDSIFALPAQDSDSELSATASQQLCHTDSGLPSGVSNGPEPAPTGALMLVKTKVWKNLVCLLPAD